MRFWPEVNFRRVPQAGRKAVTSLGQESKLPKHARASDIKQSDLVLQHDRSQQRLLLVSLTRDQSASCRNVVAVLHPDVQVPLGLNGRPHCLRMQHLPKGIRLAKVMRKSREEHGKGGGGGLGGIGDGGGSGGCGGGGAGG